MLFNYYRDYRRQCGCIKLQIERPTGAWREEMQGCHLKSTFGTAYYNYSGLAGMLAGHYVVDYVYVWAHGAIRGCTIICYMQIKKSVKAEEA